MLDSFLLLLLLGTLAITSVPLFMSSQKNGTTSMISAHQFILLIFSMQAVGLFEYFFLLNSMKLCL